MGNFSLSVTVCVNQRVCDGVTGCQNGDDESYTKPFCVRYEVIRKHSAEKKAELYFYWQFVTHWWRIQNFWAPTLQGAPIYDFAKTTWNWKNLGGGGKGTCPKFHYVDLPLHTVLTNEKTILNCPANSPWHNRDLRLWHYLNFKRNIQNTEKKMLMICFCFFDLIYISATFKYQSCLNIIVRYVQRIGPIWR